MDFLRKIVSGPKNRFREDGYNLDLTYICTRLIAMSYPASGVESVYRNPIDKVTKFIRERHANNFLVFNLSCRMYDYSKFGNQVLDFQWEDHHSPPIHTLFQICQKIQFFLFAKSENVCIIHCLAGKGRTGTIICCFLIYSGLIQSPTEALHYYSKKRFIKQGFGVNQPCQIRYLQYFFEVLHNRLKPPIYPKLVYIKKIVFHGRPNFNAQKGCRPYFDIIYVRTKHLIFSTRRSYSESAKFEAGTSFEIPFEQHVALAGDLLIRIKNSGQIKNQKMARISINTAFIPDQQQGACLRFKLEELSPSSLLKDSRFPKDIVIEIHFGSFCNCSRHTAFKDKCSICGPQLMKERDTWEIMQRIIKNYQPLSKRDQRLLLFGNPNEDDVDLVLNSKVPLSNKHQNIVKNTRKQPGFVVAAETGQTNRFKFDCETDRFVAQTQGGGNQEDGDIPQANEPESPVKTRQRSDMRYNIYSDDSMSYSASNHMRLINNNTQKIDPQQAYRQITPHNQQQYNNQQYQQHQQQYFRKHSEDTEVVSMEEIEEDKLDSNRQYVKIQQNSNNIPINKHCSYFSPKSHNNSNRSSEHSGQQTGKQNNNTIHWNSNYWTNDKANNNPSELFLNNNINSIPQQLQHQQQQDPSQSNVLQIQINSSGMNSPPSVTMYQNVNINNNYIQTRHNHSNSENNNSDSGMRHSNFKTKKSSRSESDAQHCNDYSMNYFNAPEGLGNNVGDNIRQINNINNITAFYVGSISNNYIQANNNLSNNNNNNSSHSNINTNNCINNNSNNTSNNNNIFNINSMNNNIINFNTVNNPSNIPNPNVSNNPNNNNNTTGNHRMSSFGITHNKTDEVDEDDDEEDDSDSEEEEYDNNNNNNNNNNNTDSDGVVDALNNTDQMNEGTQYCFSKASSIGSSSNFIQIIGNCPTTANHSKLSSPFANAIPNTITNQHFNNSAKKFNQNNKNINSNNNPVINSAPPTIEQKDNTNNRAITKNAKNMSVFSSPTHQTHLKQGSRISSISPGGGSITGDHSKIKLVCLETDSLEDIDVESDDGPCPQKPFQGDQIFFNRINH